MITPGVWVAIPVKQTSTFLATLILFTLVSPLLMASQDSPEGRQHGRGSLTLIRTQQPVVLDGRLDEDAWGEANVERTFSQRDPEEGMPATEKTEIRALYDEESLYFGVKCFDSDAEGILATELRRDNAFINDDSFAVILDTFHDHRNAFLFRINPRGTQFDALITEEGRDVNVSWDERWEVETRIEEDGWSAEIRIPLSSIRFSASSGESTTFGVDFERIIRRKNEFIYWNNFSRDFDFHQVSQAGHLLGMAETGNHLKVRIKPYLSTRINTRGAAQRSTILLGDVGLENLKYPLTSGLTLDVTLNTDFAETEVDDQIINFSRVPTFFPEKREFFLEGAGIFEFGLWRGEGRPQIQLYHSRRIGLSESGEEIPMLGGVKVVGKVGDKFTLAFLEAQTDDFNDKPGDNFAVFRLKRDVLSRSSLGFFFTNRQAEGGDFNRVMGIDQNLIFLDHLGITGMLGRSFTDGVSDDQSVGALGVAWQDDLIDTSFDYTVMEDKFEADLGFLERPGTRKVASLLSISPRPNSDTIRQLYLAFRFEDFQRVEDRQLDARLQHFNFSTFFQDGSSILFRPHHPTQILMEELRLPGGLRVPPGRYTWWFYWVTYGLNPARKLSGDFSYRYEKDYYGEGGLRQTWDFQPVIKFSSRFSAEVAYSINRVQLPQAEAVTFHQVNNRLNIAFSRKWLTSTLLQYNSASDLIGVNFRLNYIYRPGDDLFIVFNSFSDRSNSPAELDRSLAIKLTHSFDF